MIDHILFVLTLAAVAGLVALGASAGRRPGANPRLFGALLFGLILAYAVSMAWAWARRAADFEQSHRALTTIR